jgi:hypothetical protein
MSCTGRFWLVAGSCAITGNRRSEQASRSPQIDRRQRCTITTNKGKGWSWSFGGRVEMGTTVGVIRFNRRIVSRKTGVTGDNARNFRFRIGIIARLIGLLVTFGGVGSGIGRELDSALRHGDSGKESISSSAGSSRQPDGQRGEAASSAAWRSMRLEP